MPEWCFYRLCVLGASCGGYSDTFRQNYLHLCLGCPLHGHWQLKLFDVCDRIAEFSFYIIPLFVYVWRFTCMCVGTPIWMPALTSGVFPVAPHLILFETWSLTEPSACWFSSTGCPAALPRIRLCLLPLTGITVVYPMSNIHVGAGVPNASLRASAASASSTKPIPHPVLCNSNRLEIVTHCSWLSNLTGQISRLTINTKSFCKLARTIWTSAMGSHHWDKVRAICQSVRYWHNARAFAMLTETSTGEIC